MFGPLDVGMWLPHSLGRMAFFHNKNFYVQYEMRFFLHLLWPCESDDTLCMHQGSISTCALLRILSFDLSLAVGKKTALKIHASTNFETSCDITSLRSFARTRFFCQTGNARGWMFNMTSANSRGMPVISAGVQAKISMLEHEQSLLREIWLHIDSSVSSLTIAIPSCVRNFMIECKVDAIAPSCFIAGCLNMTL
ncbi:hypothetical protein Tco_1548647 [Tanacetum coccineum]